MARKRVNKWERFYNLLIKYVEENNGVFPLKRNEMYKEENIGGWCSFQRTKYKQGKLSEERVTLLKAINFPFNLQDYIFEVNLKRVADFIAENGTTTIPYRKYEKLSQFYKTLRYNYSKNALSAERLALVEKSGIPLRID